MFTMGTQHLSSLPLFVFWPVKEAGGPGWMHELDPCILAFIIQFQYKSYVALVFVHTADI
jgi:hypothetical protein